MPHLHATPAAGKAFYLNNQEGPVVMLNLLKFRLVADYSASPELAPAAPLTGEEAYARYAAHIRPLLVKAGSEILFYGQARAYLIGPEAEEWDAVLLVRHASKAAFLAFASDPHYLDGAGHRTAALADARLLPITERKLI